MLEYPKIETLYDRDKKTFKVYPTKLRWAEFDNIKRWQITEKVDGTNIRVSLKADGTINFGGRTDNAQMPGHLLNYLQATFTTDKLLTAFSLTEGDEVVLFGEGYGEKIQKGGGKYRQGVSFRLFDVVVGKWWLEPESIADIATKLGVRAVPSLGEIDFLPKSIEELRAIIGHAGYSTAAQEDGGVGCEAEGIIARTSPLLFTRQGARLMWKLKLRDF